MNSLSGYKGVHLLGSQSKNGATNLAIFNSIVHISSEPAQIGFIMRPLSVPRHSYNNILELKDYTLNHVHESFLENAHFTSAKFPEEQSEFEQCKLTPEYHKNFAAPFVAQSKIKIGLKLIEDITLTTSNCHLIIGEVQIVKLDKSFIEHDGQLDLEKANNVCVTGLNQYSKVNKSVKIPYARINNLPKFK